MALNRLRLGFLALVLFALSTSLPARLNAQSTTQGAISGTVEDPTGAVVGGALVTIRNKGTNATVQVTADGSGYYDAPLLEPGAYTVTVTASGFAKYTADNVTVIVGQVTSVLPQLALSSTSTEVVVTEQTPEMNLTSPDFTDTLNLQALQSIPINNRRWSSLAMTTPGVVSDGNGYGLVSIRGVSPILNNVEIDGADDNSAFWGEERGRTREAYSTSANAVHEFAVNTGVYSAEFGRAAGGVITSVTKSGANQLHGEAYFFDRESNWNAYNDFTTETELVNGANSTVHIKPEDLRKIYGFTAGGAIIKDRLFWMYTYDQHTHVFPVVGTPDNPTNFYTLPQAALSTGETCSTATGALTGAPAAAINDTNACTLAARQHISYPQAAYDWAALVDGSAAVNVANYAGAAAITDLGLNSDIGQVSRFGYQEINTPKLDWQINQRNHWSALFHRLRWDSPGGVQTAAADQYARDTQGNDFVKLDYGLTKLTTLITNNISNEVLYQYGRELEDENQQTFTPYTEADLRVSSADTPQVGVATGNAGFNSGSPYYSYRVADPYETKWQLGDVLYWNKGNHTLKMGVDLLHNYDLVVNTYQSNGAYSFTYLGNYMNDELNFKNGVTPNATNDLGCNSKASQNGTGVTGDYPCYSTFFQGFGNPAFAVTTMDSGLFVQDNWKFNPRLTLELGLRWDHEGIPGAVSSLTTATGAFNPYTGMNNNPSDNTDFGPRIGFSYDLFGKGSTVVRGGWGMYFGRATNGNIEEVRLNTGSPAGQIDPEWKTTTAAAPVFPNVFASGAAPTCTAGSTACPTSYYFASNFKLPEIQEFDLQVQQSLGKGNFLSVSYLGSLGRRLPNFLDTNLTGLTTEDLSVVDATGSGPLGATCTVSSTTTCYQVPTYTAYGNTALLGPNAVYFSTITEMASNVNSQYNAAVVEVLNHSIKSLQFDANYTWSHALDYSQNALTSGGTNEWYDPFNNPRINYGNSSYDIPNRFVGYVLYTLPGIHSDSFVKYVTNGWSIDDTFQMQNGLPYTAGVSSFTTYGIGNYLNGSSGSTLIPQVGVNTYRYPRHEVDDLRVEKDFEFEAHAHDYNVQLLANAFNLANHQNVTSYASTALYQLSGTSVIYNKQPGTTDDTFGVVNNSNSSGFLYTPRQIEISARLIW